MPTPPIILILWLSINALYRQTARRPHSFFKSHTLTSSSAEAILPHLCQWGTTRGKWSFRLACNASESKQHSNFVGQIWEGAFFNPQLGRIEYDLPLGCRLQSTLLVLLCLATHLQGGREGGRGVASRRWACVALEEKKVENSYHARQQFRT